MPTMNNMNRALVVNVLLLVVVAGNIPVPEKV
jgi:hypothetical protein